MIEKANVPLDGKSILLIQKLRGCIQRTSRFLHRLHLKLIHMVGSRPMLDQQAHISLVTQQPLGGKDKWVVTTWRDGSLGT